MAESADVMEVIFEHCGLLRLDSLKRVCRLWHDLARAMPKRWATATITGHLSESNAMYATFALCQMAVGLPWLTDSVTLYGASTSLNFTRLLTLPPR